MQIWGNDFFPHNFDSKEELQLMIPSILMLPDL